MGWGRRGVVAHPFYCGCPYSCPSLVPPFLRLITPPLVPVFSLLCPVTLSVNEGRRFDESDSGKCGRREVRCFLTS